MTRLTKDVQDLRHSGYPGSIDNNNVQDGSSSYICMYDLISWISRQTYCLDVQIETPPSTSMWNYSVISAGNQFHTARPAHTNFPTACHFIKIPRPNRIINVRIKDLF